MSAQLVVVACPRSGTRFTARSLRSIGLDIGHERWGANGTVDWHLAAPGKLEPTGADRVVLHQVRHPLLVIGSLTTIMDSSWRFIAEALGWDSMPGDLVVGAARAWLGWTELCDAMAVHTYRVEVIPPVFGVPQGDHRRKHRDVTFEELKRLDLNVALEVERRAKRYGYGAHWRYPPRDGSAAA